ncbi:14649_t:CDS:2, partial [Gigaspora margarita]
GTIRKNTILPKKTALRSNHNNKGFSTDDRITQIKIPKQQIEQDNIDTSSRETNDTTQKWQTHTNELTSSICIYQKEETPKQQIEQDNADENEQYISKKAKHTNEHKITPIMKLSTTIPIIIMAPEMMTQYRWPNI